MSPPETEARQSAGLLDLARQVIDDVVAIRRDIHAHPELGMEETRTSALVARQLKDWGVTDVTHMAGTGLVATIQGSRKGNRRIGLRADMDALSEQNSFPYASRHPGKMHACGHDGHTAMLLGAARILAADPDFAGTVHLIFQPAEEGRGGAEKMLAEGLFGRFPCDRIFGMHSAPQLEVGQFGTRTGAMMAATGRWTVTFSGSGGHGGAGPHLTQDLTVVAAAYVNALQTVVSRNVPALEAAVISIGHIEAGSPDALNVMPSRLVMGGTIRAFSPETQELLSRRLTELAGLCASAHGAASETEVWWNSVPVITDADATAVALQAAGQLGEGVQVDPDEPATTAGEDFSFMLQQKPGNFMWLGNGSHDGDGGGQLHTPRYDFNDEALPLGIAYWLSLVNVELDGRIGVTAATDAPVPAVPAR